MAGKGSSNIVVPLVILTGAGAMVWAGITDPEGGAFAGLRRLMRGEAVTKRTRTGASFAATLADLARVGGGTPTPGAPPTTGGAGVAPTSLRAPGTVWPAAGTVTQHKTGYPWAAWAGDINQPGNETGAPVRAYRAGTVTTVNRWGHSYGTHVRITHPGHGPTLYAHLSRADVTPGQQVSAGQVIGAVGGTGNTTGPHLHFEIGLLAVKA